MNSIRLALDSIVRTIRRRTGTSNEPAIQQALRERANSDTPMDEQLLRDGFAQLGDVVQLYCDHPPELQNEYLQDNYLHRDCLCGCYLGLVEDQ